MLKGPQRVEAGLVGVGDREVRGVGHQHVDRHVVDHGPQPRCIGVRLDLPGDYAPGQHRGDVFAIAIKDRRDQQVEGLAAQGDVGLVRQIFRIGQKPALMLGGFVEYIDALALQILCLAGEQMFQRFKGLYAGLVDVVDREIFQIQRHHVDRHAVDHLPKGGQFVIGVVGKIMCCSAFGGV
jgi:hypothetical protein